MATYNSDKYTANGPVPVHGEALVTQRLHANVTLGAAPTTSDTINFGYLPPNAVVPGGILKASDMDTGGSPSLTLDVGISGTAQLFFAASTGGQSGTPDSSLAAAGKLWKNTTGAKVLVIGTAHANAATGAAGTIELCLDYFVEE